MLDGVQFRAFRDHSDDNFCRISGEFHPLVSQKRRGKKESQRSRAQLLDVRKVRKNAPGRGAKASGLFPTFTPA